jgi:hypothetical protein
MKIHRKMKSHARKFKGACQEAAQALTNPTPEAPISEQTIYRPNYMLQGLKAPHVYGYPDQDNGVRIADGGKRRVQRDHGLHYDRREYKPMVMVKMFRRL